MRGLGKVRLLLRVVPVVAAMAVPAAAQDTAMRLKIGERAPDFRGKGK